MGKYCGGLAYRNNPYFDENALDHIDQKSAVYSRINIYISKSTLNIDTAPLGKTIITLGY